jgi:hypothetical protein
LCRAQILLAVTDTFGRHKSVFEALVKLYSASSGQHSDDDSDGGAEARPKGKRAAGAAAAAASNGAADAENAVNGITNTEDVAKNTSGQLLWQDICHKLESLASYRHLSSTHAWVARRKSTTPVIDQLFASSPANSVSRVTAALYAPSYSIISSYANFGDSCLGLRAGTVVAKRAVEAGAVDDPAPAADVVEYKAMAESFLELFCR